MFSINMSASIVTSDQHKGAKTKHVPVTMFSGDGQAQMFVELKKTNKQLMSAVFAGTSHAQNVGEALTRTDIVEQLRAIKDEKFISELNALPTMKRRSIYRGKAVQVLQIKETCCIDAPSVHGVPSKSINVMMTKPGKAFKVELTSATMEYLRSCFLAQIEAGGVKRTHARLSRDEKDRVTIDEPGITFSYSRSQYRAQKKNTMQ